MYKVILSALIPLLIQYASAQININPGLNIQNVISHSDGTSLYDVKYNSNTITIKKINPITVQVDVVATITAPAFGNTTQLVFFKADKGRFVTMAVDNAFSPTPILYVFAFNGTSLDTIHKESKVDITIGGQLELANRTVFTDNDVYISLPSKILKSDFTKAGTSVLQSISNQSFSVPGFQQLYQAHGKIYYIFRTNTPTLKEYLYRYDNGTAALLDSNLLALNAIVDPSNSILYYNKEGIGIFGQGTLGSISYAIAASGSTKILEKKYTFPQTEYYDYPTAYIGIVNNKLLSFNGAGGIFVQDLNDNSTKVISLSNNQVLFQRSPRMPESLNREIYNGTNVCFVSFLDLTAEPVRSIYACDGNTLIRPSASSSSFITGTFFKDKSQVCDNKLWLLVNHKQKATTLPASIDKDGTLTFADEAKYESNAIFGLFKANGIIAYQDRNFISVTNIRNNYNTITNCGMPTSAEEQEFVDVKMYPNPVSNEVIFTSPDLIKSIEVFNTQGNRVAYLLGLNTLESIVPMYQYPDGMYFAKVNTANGIGTHKLIKH